MVRHSPNSFVSLLLLIALVFNACSRVPAQLPASTSFYTFMLGSTPVKVEHTVYGKPSRVLMINVHDDERTSVSAARQVLEERGGTLLRLLNNGKRNIQFEVDETKYLVDPNRIFHREGILQSLQLLNGFQDKLAVEACEAFAAQLLQLLPDSCLVVALHNNTNEAFGIRDYLPDGMRACDAKQVFINPLSDADNIMITTSKTLYDHMVHEGFNVVYQWGLWCKQDGSLSIYCEQNNKPYINIETEHGQLKEYAQMLFSLFGSEYVQGLLMANGASITPP